LPVGHYRAIAVDPPSHFKARTALQVQNWNSRRDVEKHYRTVSFEQLGGDEVDKFNSTSLLEEGS
jgi:hypothetical protein